MLSRNPGTISVLGVGVTVLAAGAEMLLSHAAITNEKWFLSILKAYTPPAYADTSITTASPALPTSPRRTRAVGRRSSTA